jgi:hypothetical protein
MGSRLIQVVGIRDYALNFDAGGPFTVPLGQRAIDVRDAYSGVLLVRGDASGKQLSNIAHRGADRP